MGNKRRRMPYISSLPNIMQVIRIPLPIEGIAAKLPMAPTSPKPGPILNKEAIDAEIAVVKSTPMNESNSALRAEIPINKKVSAATLERSSESMVLSPTFT